MITDRDLLIGRLAAERARLLYTLVGLSRADLTEPPVVADWTAANILAHIGDWDRFFAARIRMVVAGRSMEIEGINSPGDRNPALHERIKMLTLEQSIEEMESARSEFLNLLVELVDDKTLRRSQPVQWGSVTIRSWTVWRGRHDYNHTKDLSRWRRTLPSIRRGDPPIGPASLLRAALKAANDDLLMAVRLIPEAEQAIRPLAGTWTLKDIVKHVTDGHIDALVNLYPMEDSTALLLDDERASQRNVEARAAQPWKQVFQKFQRSYVALETALSRMTDADLNRPLNDRYTHAYACFLAPLEHMLKYAALLRSELGLSVPGRLRQFKGLYAE